MNLLIVILFLLLGLLLEYKYKIVLFKSMKERILVTLIVFLVIMSWELINYKYFQAWIYTGPGMIGVYVWGLPLELYLFYLTSPYFSFVVYELIHREVDNK